MSSKKEALRIKILQSRLRRAQLQEEEAEKEQIQRALALQDQEEEIEFNRQQRGYSILIAKTAPCPRTGAAALPVINK